MAPRHDPLRDELRPAATALRECAVPLLGVVLAACNPYVAAVSVVSESYGVATDERSLSVQASDTEIEAEIERSLLESPTPGTGSLDVFSRRGVVVLSGVVPPGSDAGRAAVKIARKTPGVRRVETFFVASQPSKVSDFELKEKIKATFVADPNVLAEQVDVAVYAGHVVLIGVVGSMEQSEEFVNDASSVPGVMSVRSYIQVTS
jgi:hyperosmotically inducible protein